MQRTHFTVAPLILLSGILVTPATPDEPSAPALSEILNRWKARTSQYSRVECEFERYTYDMGFKTERRCSGRWLFDSTGQAKWELNSSNYAPGEVGRRTDRNAGKPFKLESDVPSVWISHWDAITELDPKAKTFERWVRPPAEAEPYVSKPRRGWFANLDFEGLLLNRFEFPMPRSPGKWTVDSCEWKTTPGKPGEIRLHGVPRTQDLENVLSSLDVILDGESFDTVAVRLVDPTRAVETVYVFKNVRINQPWSDDVGEAPFHWSREEYKKYEPTAVKSDLGWWNWIKP